MTAPSSLRLFTCVRFSPGTSAALFEATEELRARCASGRFCARENYHLTLTFLGEVEQGRLFALRQALAGCVAGLSPFDLTLRGLGSFGRDGGLVVWAGAAPCPALLGLQKAQRGALETAGFSGAEEKRPYRPHLTLARQAVFPRGFEDARRAVPFGPVTERVERLSLMKSERVAGRLRYTELFAVSLG